MKKLIFLLVFVVSTVFTYGQRIDQIQLADAATMTDNDTTVWIKMKLLNGRALQIIFTDLSADTDSIDVGVSNNDSSYMSIGSVYGGTTYPLTLDKTNYLYISAAEGDTINTAGVDFDGFRYKYGVFKYYKIGSTTGKTYLQY